MFSISFDSNVYIGVMESWLLPNISHLPVSFKLKFAYSVNLFNSCVYLFVGEQVLPVMVMGTFIPGLRRKYPVHEYISATLLVVGLILFTLADANSSPNFSAIGIVMITGALVMDAFLGNLQEVIFTMNPETTQVFNCL